MMALVPLICCAAGDPVVRRDPVYHICTTSALIGGFPGGDHGAKLIV
jgi:hypothetical protein